MNFSWQVPVVMEGVISLGRREPGSWNILAGRWTQRAGVKEPARGGCHFWTHLCVYMYSVSNNTLSGNEKKEFESMGHMCNWV